MNIELVLPAWIERKDSSLQRESAVALAEAILSARENLLETHLREALSIAVWKFTSCDGKYKTRFRSRGAIVEPKGKLNHEHVITRKSIVDLLLGDSSNTRAILQSSIACTVLKSEHTSIMSSEKLNSDLRGWDRYLAAGIEVYDLHLRRRII